MTTYLAYDPERIGVLAASMRAALDELRGCTCDEPLASDAVGRVRHAALHLEQLWVPLLERIDRCDPLGAVDATRLDLDDAAVALARAMAERSGWQVVETDPLAVTMGAPPTAPPTVDEVRALAAVLQDGDLHHVVDTPGEQAWLAAQLTSIAADPILAAALAGGFDRWDAFADELGHVRLDLLDGRSTTADAVPATVPDSVATEVDDVDATFAAIAHIDAAVHGVGSLPALTRTMEPYAAAALVARAGLDPTTLARLSVEVLHRLDTGRPPLWPEDRHPGPKSGDLLFATILATPGAATAFVVAVRAQPQLLWWSAADSSLAQRVALEGTAPSSIGTTEAHLVLHAFADWFAHFDALSRNDLVFTAHPFESRSTLGALAAPWLVQYGPGTDDWGTDAAGRRADLAFILDDGSSRDALFVRMDDAGGQLTGMADRHRDDQAVAAAMGMLVQLEVDRRVRAAEDAKGSWDATWELIGKAITYGGRLMGPEGATIAKMAAQAVTEVKRVTDRTGWLGAPSPPGDVDHAARAEQQRVLLGAAATAVMAGYLTLVDAGDLPPSTPPPPVPTGDPDGDVQAYWRAYSDWKLVNLPAGSPAELVLDEQYHLFLSAADLGSRQPGG